MTAVEARTVRFRKTHPCPICGGGDDMPRGRGQRCSGYLSSDGRFAYCTREEHAGQAQIELTDPPSYRHILEGECRCGVTHAPARASGDETYDYLDEAGKMLFQVVRMPGKQFRQRRPDGNGGWLWQLGETRRVLYRLPRLEQARRAAEFQGPATVYVVEGEKDVHAVERAGGLATCNPGGAGKWRSEYADNLAGFTVVIVADRDEPGLAHAHAIAATLPAATTTIVQAASGKDAADHLAGGGTLANLEPLVLLVPGQTTVPAAAFSISVYSARELATLEIPEGAQQLAGPFVRRGMITLLAGITGHGKTTLIAQTVKAAAEGGNLIGHDVDGGNRVLVLDLEQHLASIQRVINQAGLSDTDRVDYAPIPEGLALDRRSDQLDEVRRVLSAKEYDIVVLDPFYKLHEADSNDEQQARLLVALLRGWIKEFGFSILTATHCRKLPAGRNYVIVDDLFGSSLFTRDPELILAIQRYGALTKLQVLKSREPELSHGETFELLHSRTNGLYLKPTKTPEETENDLRADAETVVDYINKHPGASTNAIREGTKFGQTRVKNALQKAITLDLIPEHSSSSRGGHAYFPHNHAPLTSTDQLSVEVGEREGNAESHSTSTDFTPPSYRRRSDSRDEVASDPDTTAAASGDPYGGEA